MAEGIWTGAERATGNLAATGMRLMEFRANQANRAEQLMMERDRLRIMEDQAKIENAKSQMALDEARNREEALNRPIDITTHPSYLSIPDAQKPEVLKYFSSNKFTDERGIGKARDIQLGVQAITQSKPLFEQFMAPVIQAKQASVVQAWNELAAAKSTGDPKKIQAAEQRYGQLNAEYHTSIGKFDDHLKSLDEQAGKERLKQMELDARAKEGGGTQVTNITSPDGKTEQTFQFNNTTQRYDIPVGPPHPIRSQVPNININTATPEQAKGEADSIARGLMAPNTFLSKRGQAMTQIRQEVRNLYPNFNFNKAEANYKYMVNPNNLRTIGLVKATMPRVDDLMMKVDAIANKAGLPFIDQPLNKARAAVGNVPVVDYESLRNAIIQEVNTALSGSSVATDYRVKLELENLGSNRTPAQLKAAITNLKSALEARSDASLAIPFSWEDVRGEKPAQAGGGMVFDSDAITAELERRKGKK